MILCQRILTPDQSVVTEVIHLGFVPLDCAVQILPPQFSLLALGS